MLEGIAENNRKAKEEMAKVNNKMEGAVKNKLGSSKVSKRKKLKRKKRKEVDPKAPKRPMSAYFEFASKERQKVKVMLKSRGCKEVSKELGRMWNSFSEEERAPFVARANEKMKKFKQEQMEYNSQKAERERLLSKARRSIAAPFFNFVTENWCSVAAAMPNLDGKEVQELLWQQWMGRCTMGKGGKEDLTVGESDASAAIASVNREKSVKRKKAVVNLEKVKLEGRQVEANRGESEIKEESLTFFKERINSELERVAPSRDPHQGDAGDPDDIKRAAVKTERVRAEAVKKPADENSRLIKLAAGDAERWMEEKKQQEEKRRQEIQGKEEKRKTEVARLRGGWKRKSRRRKSGDSGEREKAEEGG